MKKQWEEKKEETRIRREFYCDLCEINLEDEEEDCYDHKEAEIWFLQGSKYPEDGLNAKGKKFDICSKCMKEKVIPLIEKEFALEAREVESEYD